VSSALTSAAGSGGSQPRKRTARQLRAGLAHFSATFCVAALRPELPLRFPTQDANALAFRALSWYRYPGWAALLQAERVAVMSAFFIALHLIDFSPLRAELVALTRITLNGRGQTPFDPVSLFLCCLLRLAQGLGWKALAHFLADEEGACWRRLLGFGDHTPSATTMRDFYHALGCTFEADLCPRFVELLHTAGWLPAGDDQPSPLGLAVAWDGMLHSAHSSMQCGQVRASCYQPTTPQEPRPCPAREQGLEGCTCSEPACAEACRLATPRDPEARLIHYTGTNQDGEEDPARSRNVYGYRSGRLRIVDDTFHIAWSAYVSVHPANTDERVIFPHDFARLQQRLPFLTIAEVVADAALGYVECLATVYDAGAIPIIAIRRDPLDRDPAACLWRGYDRHGRPLCAHGYPMSPNGIDRQRLRAGWVCRQRCTRVANPSPQDESCPFRDPDHPLGQVRHVARAFVHPDGTRHARLARLIPYGSQRWKALYASRKNAPEECHSQLARLGLKRVSSYGLTGAAADIICADFLDNLRTLGRLVQEATLLVAHAQAAAP
jgi:hypothetical protein